MTFVHVKQRALSPIRHPVWSLKTKQELVYTVNGSQQYLVGNVLQRRVLTKKKTVMKVVSFKNRKQIKQRLLHQRGISAETQFVSIGLAQSGIRIKMLEVRF